MGERTEVMLADRGQSWWFRVSDRIEWPGRMVITGIDHECGILTVERVSLLRWWWMRITRWFRSLTGKRA